MTGKIHFIRPESLHIFIDGQEINNQLTPVIMELSAGKHFVQLRDNNRIILFKVFILPGITTRIALKLDTFASLSLSFDNPPHVEITIENTYSFYAPLHAFIKKGFWKFTLRSFEPTETTNYRIIFFAGEQVRKRFNFMNLVQENKQWSSRFRDLIALLFYYLFGLLFLTIKYSFILVNFRTIL